MYFRVGFTWAIYVLRQHVEVRKGRKKQGNKYIVKSSRSTTDMRLSYFNAQVT